MPVLGIAAIVFTAGAALPGVGALLGGGALATGGFGAAIASGVSALGLTGTVGSALTGALTYAGWGAVAGAATSAITGGKPLKGAIEGGASGLALGGVMGGLGLTGAGAGAASKAGEGLDVASKGGLATDALTKGGTFADVASKAPGILPSAAAPTAAASGGGIFGFAKANPELTGSVIKGIGGALSSQADADSALQRDQNQRDYYNANYKTGGAGLFNQGPQPAPAANLRNPSDAFPTPSPNNVGHYEYDPTQRKLVFIPPQTQLA